MSDNRNEGFWAKFRASKGPPELEELSDSIQRPLGYILARLLYPTRVSPNVITLSSGAVAIAAGICFASTFRWHLPAGGLLLFTSAVFDSADGQLARLRGTGSLFGRMLDGTMDAVSALGSITGVMVMLWHKYAADDWRLAVLAVAAAGLTVYTGSQHTSIFDHYKNVWNHFQSPEGGSGDDAASAKARYEELRPTLGLGKRIVWHVYLVYLSGQAQNAHMFDPEGAGRFDELPPWTPEHAKIYRARCFRFWKFWKFYGFGTVVIGIAIFASLDLMEVYCAIRLLGLHMFLLFYLRPRQRQATRAALEEIAAAETTRTPA